MKDTFHILPPDSIGSHPTLTDLLASDLSDWKQNKAQWNAPPSQNSPFPCRRGRVPSWQPRGTKGSSPGDKNNRFMRRDSRLCCASVFWVQLFTCTLKQGEFVLLVTKLFKPRCQISIEVSRLVTVLWPLWPDWFAFQLTVAERKR